MGLADLGGDHVQTQDPERLRVVVGGVPDQRRHRIRRGGSRSAGSASTAVTITCAWSTSSRPSASATRTGSNRSEPERPGELGLAVRCGLGSAGWRAPTSSPYWWHPSRPPPARSGRGGRAGLRVPRPGPPAGSRDQRCPSLGRVHRPCGLVAQRLQLVGDPGQANADRVVPTSGVRGVRSWVYSTSRRRHPRTVRSGLWRTTVACLPVDAKRAFRAWLSGILHLRGLDDARWRSLLDHRCPTTGGVHPIGANHRCTIAPSGGRRHHLPGTRRRPQERPARSPEDRMGP